jgi:hypothetical protein
MPDPMPAAKSAGFETAFQKVRLWFGHSDCMVCQPYTNTYRNALIIIGYSKSRCQAQEQKEFLAAKTHLFQPFLKTTIQQSVSLFLGLAKHWSSFRQFQQNT